jgi:pimeloyl-ACP methyl ester carboxylesterase
MRSREYRTGGQAPAKCLIVLLPGSGDNDAAFEEHHFVEAIGSRQLQADIIAANATIGYYAAGTVWDRLSTDVVEPALARGYQRVWVAGISMGGLGALMYANRHPDQVSGVMVMAPFLGDRSLIRDIGSAGGLAKWKAPARPRSLDTNNYPLELWRWLQAVTSGVERGPRLYLGYGRRDKLAPAAHLLAAELPPDHVYETGGGHAWGPWEEQWATFLDNSEIRSDCAP